MKVVVDVNFPPALATALEDGGVDAIHWTGVGAATAPDAEILAWAKSHGHVVLTQDLDFPEILATTGASAPSVILVRNVDGLHHDLSATIEAAVDQCRAALEAGAIVVLDVGGRRIRTLPIR